MAGLCFTFLEFSLITRSEFLFHSMLGQVRLTGIRAGGISGEEDRERDRSLFLFPSSELERFSARLP